MSGLEIVQAMIEGRFPHPSMAETIPMRATEAARGHVKFRVRADAGVGYGTVDLDVKLLDGALLAHATCTCAILRKQAV